MPLSDELAQRRLAQFEARHGARLTELAAAASLPVVLDPRLVHLLRINFFVDGDSPLPWTAETDLLFSPLCTDLDDGLFEIEPTVRTILLGRLQRDGGPARIRDIASLLWAYLHQRPSPWAHEPGLERAQELTALQVLDPYACEVWLERAQTAVDRDVRAERPWFVAIQRKLAPWRDLLERWDLARTLRAQLEAIAVECTKLRSMDFLADVRPPLREEVNLALDQLEMFEKLARTVRDNDWVDNLAGLRELVDKLEVRVARSRFVLLYSALLRLPFEHLVNQAREVGWEQRRFGEVVISGMEGLAHRWLAARLYEERGGSGDSVVFAIHKSTGGGWEGPVRRVRVEGRREIFVQLDSPDPGAVERWVMLLLEKVGRTLPEFVRNTDDSQEQILFKLAAWLGLDTESVLQRLARVPVRLDEVVVQPGASLQPARRDVEGRDAAAAGGRHVIATIGIGRYGYQPWSSPNSVADARAVTTAFQRLGFALHTQLLDNDATGEAMHRLVVDDLQALDPDDSLVLLYSGQAETQTSRPGNQEVRSGYLIPVDADPDKVASWISVEHWLRMVARLPARHILVILDICSSELLLSSLTRWRVAPSDPMALELLRARRSRRVIAAAGEDQWSLDSGPISGRSLFARCLIDVLTYRPQETDRSFITVTEVAACVVERIAKYPHSVQIPEFGIFDFDDRGEMVIPLSAPQRSVAPD